MKNEEMTYEEKAKRMFKIMGISPTQDMLMLVMSYLELEYELGGRDELKKQLGKDYENN